MNKSFLIRTTLYLVLLTMVIYLLTLFRTERNPAVKTHIPIEVIYENESSTVDEALAYCDSSGFNKKFALLVDLSKHSGNYRLFALNLESRDTILKGLVAHGHCNSTDSRLPHFSNTVGSHCSSLGHYQVANKYTGDYGTSYKLIGLDSTNSNALDRYVVLHAHSCIPDSPSDDDICESEGCPTVSPNILAAMEPYLNQTKKPILLWIYD